MSVSIGGGGAAGIAVSGAGAVARNIILTKSNAFIDGSDLSSAAEVDLDASSEATIRALVVSASAAVGVGGTAGIGASVGVSIARNFIGWDPTAVPASLDTDDALRELTHGDEVKVLGGARNEEVYKYLGKDATRYDIESSQAGASLSYDETTGVGTLVNVPSDYTGGVDKGAGGIYRYSSSAGGTLATGSDEDYTDSERWTFIGVNELDFGDTKLWMLVLPDDVTGLDAAEVQTYILDSNVSANGGDITLEAYGNETIDALTFAGSVAAVQALRSAGPG